MEAQALRTCFSTNGLSSQHDETTQFVSSSGLQDGAFVGDDIVGCEEGSAVGFSVGVIVGALVGEHVTPQQCDVQDAPCIIISNAWRSHLDPDICF